jgi:hypothetical protein
MVLKGNRDPALISAKAYFSINDGRTIAARRATICAARTKSARVVSIPIISTLQPALLRLPGAN